jgi:hypothetical protein
MLLSNSAKQHSILQRKETKMHKLIIKDNYSNLFSFEHTISDTALKALTDSKQDLLEGYARRLLASLDHKQLEQFYTALDAFNRVYTDAGENAPLMDIDYMCFCLDMNLDNFA